MHPISSVSLENPNTPLLCGEKGVTQTLRKGPPRHITEKLVALGDLPPNASPSTQSTVLITPHSSEGHLVGQRVSRSPPRGKEEAGEFHVGGSQQWNYSCPTTGDPECFYSPIYQTSVHYPPSSSVGGGGKKKISSMCFFEFLRKQEISKGTGKGAGL